MNRMLLKLKNALFDYGMEIGSLVLVAVILLFAATSYADTNYAPMQKYTPAQMARLLDKSAALLQLDGGFCTATKIGSRMWLTAGHCADSGARIETQNEYLYPRSITIASQKKSDGAREEDWAIINTATEDRSIPALPLGCNDTIYPGMPVAYLGYLSGVDRGFIMGYVSSMREVRFGGNNADWVLDLPVAGGASGSAIVSMVTGNIVAVLTEGVWSNRTGFFMAAAESVKNLDWCEDYNERLQHQEDLDGGERRISSPAPAAWKR